MTTTNLKTSLKILAVANLIGIIAIVYLLVSGNSNEVIEPVNQTETGSQTPLLDVRKGVNVSGFNTCDKPTSELTVREIKECEDQLQE